MRFSPSLPPLVILLLLAFLWLILFVLLIWFIGPWRSSYERRSTRANADEPKAKARGSRNIERDTREAARESGVGSTRTAPAPPQPPPQTSRVRVVNSAERKPDPDKPQSRPNPRAPEADLKDAFDDFIQPENRRDDLDF